MKTISKVNSKMEPRVLKNLSELSPKILALVLQDATGVEVNFPDLDTDEIPEIGDHAEIDNKAIDGEYIFPSGDTYVFVNGRLTEIIYYEVDSSADVLAKLEDLQNEGKKMSAEIQNIKKLMGIKENKRVARKMKNFLNNL